MTGDRVVSVNRRAYHDYDIEETYEAGIQLTGCEIKSIREGKVNIRDSFARVENGELWLYNMHISPYDKGNIFNVNPIRTRKLLLHKPEIHRLIGKTQERGLTLIPLKLYIKRGYAKVQLAVARGRKLYDKRRVIAERDAKRQIERALWARDVERIKK